MISAVSPKQGWAGFAVEIGEPSTHGSYEKFQKSILSKARLDSSRLSDGIVTYIDSLGSQQVEIRAQEPLHGSPVLVNGTVRNWKAPFYKYGSYNPGGASLVEQSWKGDTLTVRAGGHTFTSQVTADGNVRFENR